LQSKADSFILVLDSILCGKLSRAEEGYKKTLKEYEEYSEYVGPKKQEEYEKLERNAQEQGGDAKKIYTASSQPGELMPFAILHLAHILAALSQAEVLKKSSSKESKRSGETSPMAWLLQGTHIQDSQ